MDRETLIELVHRLRSKTGCGMMQCKEAIRVANGDLQGAELYLRDKAFGTSSFIQYSTSNSKYFKQ